MKNKEILRIVNTLKRLALAVIFSLIMVTAFSQSDPPSNPPGGGAPGGNPPPGPSQGAHIGGGVLILLTLAVAYGGKRLYDLKKQEKEEIA